MKKAALVVFSGSGATWRGPVGGPPQLADDSAGAMDMVRTMPGPAPTPVASDTNLPARVDVVVIGGGIVGTSTALELAERGQSVLLAEKGEIGAEQSSRNWGWVRLSLRDPREIPLMIESIRIWEGLEERTGRKLGYTKCGILFAAAGEQVRFAKYQGLGNDFVLVDNRDSGVIKMSSERCAALCDRNFGIGADGVIFAMPPGLVQADDRVRGLAVLRHVEIDAYLFGLGCRLQRRRRGLLRHRNRCLLLDRALRRTSHSGAGTCERICYAAVPLSR